MPTPADLDAEAIAALAEQLVAIPSVNPDLEPGASGEREVAEFARAWMLQADLDAQLEEAAPGRPNAVGACGQSGPTLVLCAHLDTVPWGETPPPRRADGRLYGRGAYDMKGAAAAALAAAAHIASRRLPGRLLVALVADEEVASAGARHFVANHRADACILVEPSELRLVLAHKGFAWIEIVTRGRAAHGSRWDLGDSAVARMGRIAAALDAFDRETLRARRHPLLGSASQHCARISGGEGWSTYAAECRLQLERRTLPGETPEQTLAETRAAIAAAGETAEARLVLAREPLVCDGDAPIARSVRDAAASVRGAPPDEIGVGYWMDAAIFAAAGIPCVNYGPSGAAAHEPGEWVETESLATTARVLVAAAQRFFASRVALR